MSIDPIIVLGTAQPNPSDSSLTGQPVAPPSAGGTTSTPSMGASQSPGTPGAPGPGQTSPFSSFLPIMLAMLGLMIFMSFWTNRKEKKKREALMSSIGRGDEVQTIGGAVGIVHSLDDKFIVIRFEDTTKVKFVKSAVQVVLRSTRMKESPSKDSQSVETKSAGTPAKV